jgi:hypothetical protein
MARGAPASRLSHVSPDVCSGRRAVWAACGVSAGGGAEGGCARVRARSRERAPARAHPRPRPRAYSFTGGDCVAALPWLALALLQPGRIYRVRVSCAGEGKGGGGKEFGPPLRNSPFALLSPRRRDREVTRQPGGGAGQASRLKMVTEGRALF